MSNATKYGLNGSFSEQLDEFAQYVQVKATEVFKSVVIEVGSSVINLTPVDTGTALANWRLTINGVDNTVYDQKDQMNTKTLAKLIADAGPLTYGQVAYISNPVNYGPFLEYGSSKQAPNGMIRVTLSRFTDIVNRALMEHSE